jgi:Ca2+-binding EF-hand superfamily protein
MKMRALCTLALGCICLLSLLTAGSGLAIAPQQQAGAAEVQAFVLLGDARPLLVRLHIIIDDQPFTAVWDRFMQQLFKHLDINGDGELDDEELARVPSVELLLGRGGGGFILYPPERLRPGAALVKNKEGKVTIAELSDYYRKHGLAPLQLQFGATPKTMGPSGRLMAGMVKADVAKGLKVETQEAGVEPPSGTAVARTAFALLDTNRDGKLTAKQLAAAPAALLKADRNDDDVVTLEEMEASALLRPVATARAPVILLGPNLTAAELARRLQEHYAGNDVQLDKSELADFARRSPDLELTFRFSTRGMETQMQLHKDGALAATAQEKGGAVVLPLGSIQLQLHPVAALIRPDGLAGMIRTELLFDLADKDKKGLIARADRTLMGGYAGHFEMMDRNGDGKVTKEEHAAYFRDMTSLQARASASCVTLAFIDADRGLFDLLDVNCDGKLTVHEMQQAPKLLDRFDKSGKGYLTEQDLPRSWHLIVRRGPAGGIGYNALGDSGFGGARLLGQPPAPQPQKGPLWFRMMDHNGDGFVSPREFLGSAEMFRKIDTNGDGLISLEEAIQADALVRKRQ